MVHRNPNLIFDIGASNGSDTKFYLAKGFDVIAVEADPVMYDEVSKRFHAALAKGQLQILNQAAYSAPGETLAFWRDERHQKMSSLKGPKKRRSAGQLTQFDVKSIDYPSLAAISGIPHYCKIDIEGGETDFLKSISDLAHAPRYISAEAHKFEPIEELHRIGYRFFKLVDQKGVSVFSIPDPPLEGNLVEKPDWRQGSGPFGRELPGEWIGFEELRDVFQTIARLRSYKTVILTRYDCHAWNGEAH